MEIAKNVFSIHTRWRTVKITQVENYIIFLWWCVDMSRTTSLEHTEWFYLVLQPGVKLHDNILVSESFFLQK